MELAYTQASPRVWWVKCNRDHPWIGVHNSCSKQIDWLIDFIDWSCSLRFNVPVNTIEMLRLLLNLLDFLPSHDMTKPTKWVCTQGRLQTAKTWIRFGECRGLICVFPGRTPILLVLSHCGSYAELKPCSGLQVSSPYLSFWQLCHKSSWKPSQVGRGRRVDCFIDRVPETGASFKDCAWVRKLLPCTTFSFSTLFKLFSRWGDSNEYRQCIFLWRTVENYPYDYPQIPTLSAPLVCLFVLFNVAFNNSSSHITTVSGWNRELDAHFYRAASLKYHAPDTCHDTTPSHFILTLGWPVLALPCKSKCQARSS